MLKGDKPSLRAQPLQRIIINTVPAFARAGGAPAAGAGTGAGAAVVAGCRPDLQLLQNGKLLWRSSLRDYVADDGCMTFPIGVDIAGDVVLRCSHVQDGLPDAEGNAVVERVPLFRCCWNVRPLAHRRSSTEHAHD